MAVPEGLPLAVMISLAYSVRKMLVDKNFVKRLASCEIMGGANNICSDKTGTLTMNKMHVTNIWHGDDSKLPEAPVEQQDASKKPDKKKKKKKKGKSVEPDEAPKDQKLPGFKISDYFPNSNHSKIMLESLSVNTPPHETAGATDKAMIEMVERCEVDGKIQTVVDIRDRHLDPKDTKRREFTSKRKKMSTIANNVDDNEFGYDKRVHVKGASEIVLDSCTHWLNKDGNREEMSADQKVAIKEAITDYAKVALRTICVAYKDLKEGEGGPEHDHDVDKDHWEVEQNDLTCICILGIKDIIRPEVPKAVEQCKKAGVRVRMVTGDNAVTARAIAGECCLIDDDIQNAGEYSVLEGKAFFEMVGGLTCDNCKNDCPCECKPDKIDEKVKNKEVFAKIRQELCVLARSRPEDKYLMVTGLREFGDVVAVTGDGTNDAPALKKSDVGFAMGITGTDVAKGAADIILLDDNFASIVKACMWGRNIYDNIRKFLQFQLTVNVVALITAFVGACILTESPLQPIQLLWVNLIMDSLASLALATEAPDEVKLLNRDPQSRDEYIISRKMVKHILAVSIAQSIVIFTIVFAGEFFIPEAPGYFPNYNGFIYPGRPKTYGGDPLWDRYQSDYGFSRHMTIVFTSFVMMQVFNMINARKIHDELAVWDGLLSNKMFVIIWIVIFITQILLSQFTQDLFKCARAVSLFNFRDFHGRSGSFVYSQVS